jgi:hypothetical protein
MSTYFTANIAPGIIIGSSIFSIFWGCVNAMLIKRVDMKDVSVIKTALKEAGCDPDDDESQPINSTVGNDEQWSAARIMDQIEFIGD